MTEVPGCSPELYGRNKIACLKKFLNLVKTPISKYIGTDLLNPLINIKQAYFHCNNVKYTRNRTFASESDELSKGLIFQPD